MNTNGDESGGTLSAEANTLTREESPRLLSVLKEMKDGLDVVRSKVESLTAKVKQNQFPTSEGISYLEAKHLLLLSYCQSIVYYLLRKAKGLSIENHPVVRNLVEIRLFLEKIRPIDKKLEYQIQKLTKAAEGSTLLERDVNIGKNEKNESQEREEEDPLKYRPNPDMIISKTKPDAEKDGGVYRPPRFAPTSMDDDDKITKQEKQALRREKEIVRQAKISPYIQDLITDIEDRPEEVSETVGAESRELKRYLNKREKQEREEEELFIRAPVTRRDKKQEIRMKKTNGLQGLTDGFYDEIRMLPLEERENDDSTSYRDAGRGGKKNKKRKAHF